MNKNFKKKNLWLFNTVTPKTQSVILTDCYTFPCKLDRRVTCYSTSKLHHLVNKPVFSYDLNHIGKFRENERNPSFEKIQ